MTIPLGRLSPGASRDRPGRRCEDPSSSAAKPPGGPSLFGLAPGGVYPAAAVTGSAVRSYRTFSPLPRAPALSTGRPLAVCFLWHFPWGCPRRALPGTLSPWSPDFPLGLPSGHPAIWPAHHGLASPAGQVDRCTASATAAIRWFVASSMTPVIRSGQ